MKTNELSGIALDWAVAKAGGTTNIDFVWELTRGKFNPSTDWALGGKIIERERISIENAEGLYWVAGLTHRNEEWGWWVRAEEQGDTPLEAAMRCYVASKLGDEVEIPEGLYETT